MIVLKLGLWMLAPNLSLFREKLGVASFFLIVRHCARGGGYGKSVFRPFPPVLMQVFFSFIQYVGFAQLVSGLF